MKDVHVSVCVRYFYPFYPKVLHFLN